MCDATAAAAAQKSKWAQCVEELSAENQRRYGVCAIGARVDEVCLLLSRDLPMRLN